MDMSIMSLFFLFIESIIIMYMLPAPPAWKAQKGTGYPQAMLVRNPVPSYR